MAKFDFAKCRERLGYDPHNNNSCNNVLFAPTPDSNDDHFYNTTINQYMNDEGFLGGDRGYIESNGILIIFYKSHMFKKSYLGSCFINFNDIKSYKSDGYTTALIFDKGALMFIGDKSFANNLIQSLPSTKASDKSLDAYTSYIGKLEDKSSNSPHNREP